MFTGVIHHLGTITKRDQHDDVHITVATDLPKEDIGIGDSVACNGCCLTVIAADSHHLTFSLSNETLSCTAPRWQKGDVLHLERALRMGDTLDGHMVTGHVDGLATLTHIAEDAGSHRLTFSVPETLSRFIAAKGSVTLDGVSLTVNTVKNNEFSVNIIPHSWQVTTFQKRVIHDTINLEVDLIARYTARLLGK